MRDIFKAMNISEICVADKPIFKKQFIENGGLSGVDKQAFSVQVEKITWVYCLKPETLNVPAYKDAEREYSEIEVVEAVVAEGAKTHRIAEIVMRTIPYPVLLVFACASKIRLYVAHQRDNLSDPARNTIEESVCTDWLDEENLSEKDRRLFESLDVRTMSYVNFYRMYSDIVDRIVLYNAQGIIHSGAVTPDEARDLLAQAAELEKRLADLRGKLKKETQFNRRVELNVEIKRLEKEKIKLTGGRNDD